MIARGELRRRGAEAAQDGLFIEISDRAGEQGPVLLQAESVASAQKWVVAIAEAIAADA